MVKPWLLASLLFLTVVGQQPALAADGYRLYQKSDFYGDSVCEVSKSTLKLASNKLGLTLLVTSPRFEMNAVNNRSKQFANLPFKHWVGFLLNQNQRGTDFKHEHIKVGHTKIAGLDVDEYWVRYEGRSMPRDDDPKLSYNGRAYNTHVWTSKAISPPDECFNLFITGLGIDRSLGMPVRMIQFTESGRAYTTFDTHTVERCSVPTSLDVPKGYTRAADEMSLLMGNPDNSQLAALLADDLDDKPAKPHLRPWVPGMVYDDASARAVQPPTVKKRGGSANWVPNMDKLD